MTTAAERARAAKAALTKFNAAREAFEADMTPENERALGEAADALEAQQDALAVANGATVN